MSESTGGGGRRGRRPHDPPLKKRLVSMTEAQARLLRMWGRGDLSAGLRWLVDTAAPLIRRAPPEDQADVPRSGG